MKKNRIIRLLGLTLSVVIATSNMTSVVYAAETQNVEITEEISTEEDILSEKEEVEESEEVAEEKTEEACGLGKKAEVDTKSTEEEKVATEITERAEVDTKSTDEVVSFSSQEEVAAYLQGNPSNGLRLLLVSEYAPSDFYGATSVVTYEGVWMLTYATAENLNAAYEAYNSIGVEVEVDGAVEALPDDEMVSTIAPEDVPEESVETIAEDTAEVVETEELNKEREVLVAIIDTGVNIEDKMLAGRLSDKTAEGITDANGHGTTMAEIVASVTSENVNILPIAAFDENGKSTVAAVYFAMKEAMDQGANVINISACGAGESKVLNHVINLATNQGITVVVAAGNDAGEVSEHTPANVSEAITVSAVDKELNFAEYSNHGDGVDFSAVGILVKDMGTEETDDDLVYMGTSISSGYVSAYAALLLAENENTDIYESFKASATDLGDEGWDAYYGEGFLSKDAIVSVIKEDREKKEVAEEDMEADLEEEGDLELETAYSLSVGREWNETCYALVGQTVVNNYSFNGHIHIGSNTSSNGMAEAFCGRCGYNPSGPWHQGTAVLSRNPGDKVVFNNCTFTNCWTEFFFDAEFNNCTFYNCNFSNNGSGNIVRFNYCNINPSGFSGLVNTQAQSHKAHATYAGILGGLTTRWELNGTSLNGTGAACAVSNCFQGSAANMGYPAYIKIMNGSRVFGGNVCAVDAWLSVAPNVAVYVDSSSRIDSSPVGIYNQGNTYVNSGSIKGCSDAGIANYNVATISGGTITGNTNGIRNWGSLTVNGGGVRDNASWGIVNSGTANIISGEVKNNKAGGVYQNGTLYMSGNGKVDTANQIYLTPGHVITVNGPLHNADVGTINAGVGDRKTGRVLINFYAADSTVGENIANKFTLAFTRNDDVHTQDVMDADGTKVVAKGEQVESLIRAGYGTDQNASTNQVILSGVYYAGFEPNIEALDGMKIAIPYTFNKFYYGEKYLPDTPNHAFTTGENNHPTVVVTMPDGGALDITKSLSFKGWALDPEETDESRIYTTEQEMAMYGDFQWHAIWNACFDLYFDGNEQTRGENYQLNEFHMDTPLPGNVGPEGTTKNYFGKEDVYKASEKTWYDENKETYVDMTVSYSYQGWSLRDNAIYTDADVVNPEKEEADTLGEALGIGSYKAGVKWLIEKIKSGEIKGFDEEGRAIVPIYVVWDQAPVIEAYDLYVSKDEVESLGEEPFWENVTARDKEDGTLENKVDVTIVNFDKSELDEIEGDRGGVSVTYRAEDGAGNVTFYTVIVNVISNTAMTSWTPNADGSKRDTANYVRFIDRENYNKHVTADGGMEEHSVWYTKPEYVDLITTAFDHIDNKTSVISYELDLATMQAIQQYNHDHFGEVLETSYRTNFYEQFLAPNVVSGSL